MTRPDYWKDCTEACEATQICATCGHRKAPMGRAIPLTMYMCDRDCEGYDEDPKPGHLWPGEIAQMDKVEEDD